jgi:hypothetical protein
MDHTGWSVAESSLDHSLIASSTDESTVSPPPNKYLKVSGALVCRAGREPMQSSPDKSNIQEDIEEDRQSNCSSNSQRLIEVLQAQLSSQATEAAVAVCVAATAETKLQIVLALSPNPQLPPGIQIRLRRNYRLFLKKVFLHRLLSSEVTRSKGLKHPGATSTNTLLISRHCQSSTFMMTTQAQLLEVRILSAARKCLLFLT